MSTDFNINNYEIRDLISIFDIDVIMSKGQLTAFLAERINNYKKNGEVNYAAFFSQGLNRLLLNYDDMIEIIKKDENENEDNTHGGNVFKNEYYDDGSKESEQSRKQPDRQNNVIIANKNHSTLVQKRLSVPNTYNPSHIQGNLNPTFQNTYTTWINVDSHYREITDNTSSSSCTFNIPPTKIDILGSSTDFTFNLSESLTNVVGMTLGSMEIPMNAYYPVSEQYGTNSFDISCNGVNHCIKIPEGFYPAGGSIENKITSEISTVNFVNSSFVISIDQHSGKTTIKNTNTNILFDIIFYSKITDCNENNCFQKNSGKKIDSNLGWLLGFRQPSYTGVFKYYIRSIGKSMGNEIFNIGGR